MAMKQHPLTAITVAQTQNSQPTAPTNTISTLSSLLFPLTAHGPLVSPTPPPARSPGSFCTVETSTPTSVKTLLPTQPKRYYDAAPYR
ncbi:hypothetical protein SLA2020_279710 [Shorea laevis]